MQPKEVAQLHYEQQQLHGGADHTVNKVRNTE